LIEQVGEGASVDSGPASLGDHVLELATGEA
jgi:hypothetical protein